MKKKYLTFFSPEALMMTFWLLIYLVYFLGPIELYPSVSIRGFLFVLINIMTFIIGARIATRIPVLKSQGYFISPQHYTIFILLIIGILGTTFCTISKLLQLEHLSFMSIAKLRTIKAQNLLNAKELSFNFFSALGFITYPAAFIATIAIFFDFEKTSKKIRTVFYLYLLCLFAFTVLTGGRSPLFVLFTLITITGLLRVVASKSLLPKSKSLKLILICLLLIFVGYSSFVWQLRTQEGGKTTEKMLHHTETVWGAKPSKLFSEVSTKVDSPKVTQAIVNSFFYFIHSLSTTEKLLSTQEEVPALYGAYHIDVFAAIMRTSPGGIVYLKNSYNTLMKSGVYGYFAGAWSALFIDFKYFSLLIVLLWGFVSRLAWQEFKVRKSLVSAVIYAFCVYAIFISFVSPPWGFSNSFILFLWVLIFMAINRDKVRLFFNSYRFLPTKS